MRAAATRFGTASLIVVLAGAYVASLLLYANGSTAHTVNEGEPVGDRTTATLTVEEMQSNYSAVVANLAVLPGSAMLDPLTHRLKENLTLRVRSAAAPTHREYSKGRLPGMFPVPLTLAGHLERWPIDHYRSGPIAVQLFDGDQTAPEIVPTGRARRLNSRRPVFVAIQTVRDRRKFQPPMTTWYGAMLFAVVPLRNALPGSPPFGSWIDLTVAIWVRVALAASMAL